jgi:hypothetical protein
MEKRVRYTASDVSNNRFYKLPKFLFEEGFEELSNDARVLYALLRDRLDLSMSNGWVNECSEVYLIYKRENMANILKCSLPKVKTIVEQLKEYGLIEEERMGLNRPNRIYLTAVTVDITGHKKSLHPDTKNLCIRTQKIFASGHKKSLHLDTKNLCIWTQKIFALIRLILIRLILMKLSINRSIDQIRKKLMD